MKKKIDLTIVCCYNDLIQLKNHLIKSFEEQNVCCEKILIDNTNNKFKSASSALNYGGSLVNTEYVLFVHQDIVFLSHDSLEKIYLNMKTHKKSIIGVAGVKLDSNFVYSSILHGESKSFAGTKQIKKSIEAICVDECMFGMSKSVYNQLKFDEKNFNNWHLYAVDLCYNASINGIKTYVIPANIWHVSTGNLNHKFFVGLRRLKRKYNKFFPVIKTTCISIRRYTPVIYKEISLCKQKKSQIKNIKIYVALHKKYILPSKEGYIPIQLGAAIHEDLGILKDNIGDNISNKQPNYSEICALYYIWKNEKNFDIIGMCHYRRYFFRRINKIHIDDILSIKSINAIMKKKDIILPVPVHLGTYTVYSQYDKYHNIEDFDVCKKIIKEYYIDYLDSFERVCNSKKMYICNMFIMRKEYFENYMEWLFDILFKLENIIDVSKYDDYQKRVFGYLSERLFNVWLDKNNLKIKTLPVYNIEQPLLEQIIFNFLNKFKLK